MYYQWAPYVPVAQRRRAAAAEMAKLQKKGQVVSPVVIEGRTIATTVWGKAWCDNMEAYSDYANRLPRGRTYARNGSVVDLQVGPGRIEARVSGSSIYRITILVKPLPKAQWGEICSDCAGGIDSLVELLQGRFDKGVMARLSRQGDGLFPVPKEIHFDCSCPDSAYMCKHIAAVLYGIGARLDHQPELLFTLRQVDATELLTKAGKGLATASAGTAKERILATDDLGAMFGLEMDTCKPGPETAPRQGRQVTRTKAVGSSLPSPAPGNGSGGGGDGGGKGSGRGRGDLASRLLKELRQRGHLSCAEAQAQLGEDGATLRPLLKRLVAQGQATVSGRTRGTVYHACR